MTKDEWINEAMQILQQLRMACDASFDCDRCCYSGYPSSCGVLDDLTSAEEFDPDPIKEGDDHDQG